MYKKKQNKAPGVGTQTENKSVRSYFSQTKIKEQKNVPTNTESTCLSCVSLPSFDFAPGSRPDFFAFAHTVRKFSDVAAALFCVDEIKGIYFKDIYDAKREWRDEREEIEDEVFADDSPYSDSEREQVFQGLELYDKFLELQNVYYCTELFARVFKHLCHKGNPMYTIGECIYGKGSDELVHRAHEENESDEDNIRIMAENAKPQAGTFSCVENRDLCEKCWDVAVRGRKLEEEVRTAHSQHLLEEDNEEEDEKEDSVEEVIA
jgi:hypothetical protein